MCATPPPTKAPTKAPTPTPTPSIDLVSLCMVYCVATDKACGLCVTALPAFLNPHCLNKCGMGKETAAAPFPLDPQDPAYYQCDNPNANCQCSKAKIDVDPAANICGGPPGCWVESGGQAACEQHQDRWLLTGSGTTYMPGSGSTRL